ncbi:hypothetical protein [Thiofilum flexile]|uniref:hypothetical protein n=1 Tax=Thiofilum flexile TaxID=125627 RepID=UPI00037979DA|nr:hypothetical protein [Thiofilum flexile]
MQHFSSIEAFHQYMQWSPPEHPLLSLISLANLPSQHISSTPPITNDFYIIGLKYVLAGKMTYGRTPIDFSQGTLLFYGPRQMIQWVEMVIDKKGFIISVHEGYLRGHPIADRIKTYNDLPHQKWTD